MLIRRFALKMSQTPKPIVHQAIGARLNSFKFRPRRLTYLHKNELFLPKTNEIKALVARPFYLQQWFIAGAGDIGGTFLLPYCSEPEQAFVDMLRHFKIDCLTREEVRGPMGLNKNMHCKVLHELIIDKIKTATVAKLSNATSEQLDELKRLELAKLNLVPTVDQMYEFYLVRQDELLQQQGQAIPFAASCLIEMQKTLPFFLTTGFPQNTTNLLLKAKKNQIPTVEHVISSDEVADRSRPSMVSQGLINLGFLPKRIERFDKSLQKELIDNVMRRVFFVTDAVNDVQSVRKRFSTMNIIGVTRYGTGMGIDDPSKISEMSDEELLERSKKAGEKLLDAGADKVIPDLSQLIPTLEKIAKQHLTQRHEKSCSF